MREAIPCNVGLPCRVNYLIGAEDSIALLVGGGLLHPPLSLV